MEVTLLDFMGSDLSVVNAARVSFNKTSFSFEERDEKLINYLAEHKHLSPFGHCFASFHIKAPVFVARQLVKHKFLRWNEVSRRYVDTEPEYYYPEMWRKRAANKKQGSSDEEVTSLRTLGFRDQSVKDGYARYIEYVEDLYFDMIEAGVAPEQARMILPLSHYTEWWWSGSLDAFADMCKLRCASDTQGETRMIADAIRGELERVFPVSMSALMKYQ